MTTKHDTRRAAARSAVPRSAPISFRIDTGLKQQLEKLAQEDNRSLSAMIEIILRQYVERKR